MYGCESWTLKKAEHRRIDAFELWCWKRLLRVPWTARRSNQFILKEISPGCSLEGLVLMHLMTHWKRPWCWERLKTGIEGDDRGWDGWMASPSQWTLVWVNSGSSWWTGKPGGKSRTRLSDWTELNYVSGQFSESLETKWWIRTQPKPYHFTHNLHPSQIKNRINWVTEI